MTQPLTHALQALVMDSDEPTFAGTDGIFERKFLLPEEAIPHLLRCARQHLAPDKHANSLSGEGYTVNSLYFDDEQLGTYHALGPEKPPKYRVRRYGDSDTLFLERKSKPEGKVRKHRTLIPTTELGYLTHEALSTEWEGHWFYHHLHHWHLRPICFVSYQRIARVGSIEGQFVRFTLDRELFCSPAEAVEIPRPLNGKGRKIDAIIAEVKFEHTLPLPFAKVIMELGLEPVLISKYQKGVETCGLAPALPSSYSSFPPQRGQIDVRL